MSIPFLPQTPSQVGYHRGLIVANTSLSPSAWRFLQGEHGSSAPRAEVARTIWFASGLSGRHFLGDSHRHRNHLRCHGRALLGQDRGSLRPAAVVQALALQAMQFSVITIPEEPHPTSRACSRPTRFWAAPQLAARAPTVTAGGYLKSMVAHRPSIPVGRHRRRQLQHDGRTGGLGGPPDRRHAE